jgi:hypothetical protein
MTRKAVVRFAGLALALGLALAAAACQGGAVGVGLGVSYPGRVYGPVGSGAWPGGPSW